MYYAYSRDAASPAQHAIRVGSARGEEGRKGRCWMLWHQSKDLSSSVETERDETLGSDPLEKRKGASGDAATSRTRTVARQRSKRVYASLS